MEKKFTAFSLNKLEILPLLTDVDGVTTYADELIRAEGVQELTVTPNSETFELEGDGGIVETQTVLSGFDFSFTNGVLSFELLAALQGGTVNEIKDEAGTEVIGYEYVSASTDQAPYFGLVGKVDASELKTVLYKCKIESVEVSYSNKEYAVVSVSGKAIKRSDNKIKKEIRSKVDTSVTDFK